MKLQRNALSVLEAPSGNEDHGDLDCDNSSCGCLDIEDKDVNYCKTLVYRTTMLPLLFNTKSFYIFHQLPKSFTDQLNQEQGMPSHGHHQQPQRNQATKTTTGTFNSRYKLQLILNV